MKAVLPLAPKIASVAALLVGLLLGGLMFYVAGTDNPQHEFHGAEWSSPSSWALVFAAWFAAGFAASFVAVLVIAFALLKIRSTEGEA
jgi:hypothetical protein